MWLAWRDADDLATTGSREQRSRNTWAPRAEDAASVRGKGSVLLVPAADASDRRKVGGSGTERIGPLSWGSWRSRVHCEESGPALVELPVPAQKNHVTFAWGFLILAASSRAVPAKSLEPNRKSVPAAEENTRTTRSRRKRLWSVSSPSTWSICVPSPLFPVESLNTWRR